MQKTVNPSSFHVMVKPAGARCNLRCQYCFFLKKKNLYPQSPLYMSDAILERFIRQTISAQQVPVVTFSWQGGEPTLMGVDFFRRVKAFQKRSANPQIKIENTFQTNGVLLDEEWCEFLYRNRFLVGLSIDGPGELHNTFRKDGKGRSVFDKVIRAVRLLQKFNVEFNILCTVNAVNSRYPLEVYRFFRDELGARYLQFIPLVERDNATGNQQGDKLTNRSVQSQSYGEFLNEIFDEWIRRDVGKMFVQFFDGVLASYVYGHSPLCVLSSTCGRSIVLEHNGDVYSCDHYVEPDYFLGNIRKTAIDKLVNSDKQHDFGSAKSASLPSCCRKCEYLFTCYGECPKNRVLLCSDGSGRVNWLCEGLKMFFAHTEDSMRKMALLLREGRDAEEIMLCKEMETTL